MFQPQIYIYLITHKSTSHVHSNYIFSCSYIFIFIYMYKHVIKMSQLQRIWKISHITCFRACWSLIERVQKIIMSTIFNEEMRDFAWWNKKNMSINWKRKKKSHEISRIWVGLFNVHFLLKSLMKFILNKYIKICISLNITRYF